MINTPSSTNSSSLDKSRANLVSLLWQAAGVFLIFLVMLVLTAGKPSGWMLPITFLIAGGFVVWAEVKRERRFYKRKPTALQLTEQAIEQNSLAQTNEQDTSVQIESSVPIDYLRSGKIKEWNQWRRYKTEKGANLRRVDLTRANLTGADLTGADLTEANLTGAYLTRAYLTGAYLTGANLTGANLTGANLTRAYLTEAYLTRADLTRANLTRANLTGADLTGVILNRTVVKDAVFGINPGLTDENEAELEERGAVFQDFPGDRSEIFKK